MAVEAFSAVGGAAPLWVCIGCSGWSNRYGWTLDEPGASTTFHVTLPLNRASIDRHGLDWRRMGAARGIAGSPTPELDGIFLNEHPDDAAFFLGFETPVDVWAVSSAGLHFEEGPDGWVVSREPIAASLVRLIQADDARELDGRPPRADGSNW